MEKNTQLDIRCRDIAQQLSEVRVGELVRRLDFHDYPTLDEHVEALYSDLMTVEKHFDGELAVNVKASFPKSNFERTSIDALEESKPERIVNIVKGADYLPAQLFFNELRAHGVLPALRMIRAHSRNS